MLGQREQAEDFCWAAVILVVAQESIQTPSTAYTQLAINWQEKTYFIIMFMFYLLLIYEKYWHWFAAMP